MRLAGDPQTTYAFGFDGDGGVPQERTHVDPDITFGQIKFVPEVAHEIRTLFLWLDKDSNGALEAADFVAAGLPGSQFWNELGSTFESAINDGQPLTLSKFINCFKRLASDPATNAADWQVFLTGKNEWLKANQKNLTLQVLLALASEFVNVRCRQVCILISQLASATAAPAAATPVRLAPGAAQHGAALDEAAETIWVIEMLPEIDDGIAQAFSNLDVTCDGFVSHDDFQGVEPKYWEFIRQVFDEDKDARVTQKEFRSRFIAYVMSSSAALTCTRPAPSMQCAVTNVLTRP